jgi:hypothetical protein
LTPAIFISAIFYFLCLLSRESQKFTCYDVRYIAIARFVLLKLPSVVTTLLFRKNVSRKDSCFSLYGLIVFIPVPNDRLISLAHSNHYSISLNSVYWLSARSGLEVTHHAKFISTLLFQFLTDQMKFLCLSICILPIN